MCSSDDMLKSIKHVKINLWGRSLSKPSLGKLKAISLRLLLNFHYCPHYYINLYKGVQN